jgi:hypothetical protein
LVANKQYDSTTAIKQIDTLVGAKATPDTLTGTKKKDSLTASDGSTIEI